MRFKTGYRCMVFSLYYQSAQVSYLINHTRFHTLTLNSAALNSALCVLVPSMPWPIIMLIT
jgi:hypothetical protein